MATTDNSFSKLELKALYEFAESKNIPQVELDNCLLNPIGEMELPNSLETRIEYLYDLCLMIIADGMVTKDEVNTLRKFCAKFEFIDENIDALCEYLLEGAKVNKPKKNILKELK